MTRTITMEFTAEELVAMARLQKLATKVIEAALDSGALDGRIDVKVYETLMEKVSAAVVGMKDSVERQMAERADDTVSN